MDLAFFLFGLELKRVLAFGHKFCKTFIELRSWRNLSKFANVISSLFIEDDGMKRMKFGRFCFILKQNTNINQKSDYYMPDINRLL